MQKNYFYILLLVFTFGVTQISVAQDDNKLASVTTQNIEDLSIYPNPVRSSNAYITISTKYNFNKRVEFYNVLGKRVFAVVLTGKELNISNLKKGVYIVKITEGNVSETRKLVIK
ncbi:T9SS type A sorting domain-containing protein [Neotamlana laminarinivorans]|uniref:T9SS type A sorting domain-containing protein n=1 Tax=Neotamlana laminarinivorans TaxID=2883124 RepID=A0A9X1I0V3_9FLAO|nr:T9SS type A sorting domain-containing protein [Tamlana laminarinivorans]MCB4798513.1 T9SS type A sorting domain-containing protein [Tamlana laminarinivorans]